MPQKKNSKKRLKKHSKKPKLSEKYAESLLFQSPDPKELPMPIFESDLRVEKTKTTDSHVGTTN